jgi:hypothetical protein
MILRVIWKYKNVHRGMYVCKTSAWGFAAISSAISNLDKNDYLEARASDHEFMSSEGGTTHGKGIPMTLKFGGFCPIFPSERESISSVTKGGCPGLDRWWGD